MDNNTKATAQTVELVRELRKLLRRATANLSLQDYAEQVEPTVDRATAWLKENGQSPAADEAVYQVRFRNHGRQWVEVDKESFDHTEAYLPKNWERRVLYLRPQPATPQPQRKEGES